MLSDPSLSPEPRIASMLGLVLTAAEVLLIGLAVWLTVGITLAVLMGRRGHSAFEWFLIGAILGPIALPLAWGRISSEPAAMNREVVDAPPRAGSGPIDVLVGIDGSAESEAALRTVVDILGPRIGRLTLAGVTEFDYGSPQAQADTKRALESLRAMAESASVAGPGVVTLSGRPADALSGYALRDGYQLVVVGRRGRGASKAILGSTAAQLASAPIAVLVAP
jgi:nucleotide-binding universal stress UspA family protein